MRLKLAHVLRRIARGLIGWSRRLDPHLDHVHVAIHPPWVTYAERTDGFQSS